MQYLFKQAAKLGDKYFMLGVNEVSDKQLKDPYFKVLEKAKLVSEVKASVAAPISQKEIAEKLIEKVSGEAAKKIAEPSVAPKASPAQESKAKDKKG